MDTEMWRDGPGSACQWHFLQKGAGAAYNLRLTESPRVSELSREAAAGGCGRHLEEAAVDLGTHTAQPRRAVTYCGPVGGILVLAESAVHQRHFPGGGGVREQDMTERRQGRGGALAKGDVLLARVAGD